MSTHVKIIGWLHIVFGILGLFSALAVFGGMLLGGLFSSSAMGMLGFGLMGSFAAFFLVAMSIPGLIGGYGLLKFYSWARILMIVIAALELFRPVFGTVLGIYTLWVLLSAEGSALFKQRVAY